LQDTLDQQLRERLAGIAGVERVLHDRETQEICLLLRQNADAEAVYEAALDAAGRDARVTVAFPPDFRERQRIRFVAIEHQENLDNTVSVHVTLEWAGTQHRRTATGEKGPLVELRTAAIATLDVLSVFLPPDIKLRLAGVKQVRAFDAELTVVSVYRTGPESSSLVGVVMTGTDPLRATSVSVLNALNRLLGNYLVHP
jgi:hypothetical protein